MSEGNLCPECEGGGAVYEIYHVSYWEPPEYEELICPVCGGEGTIDTPLTEEDAA